MEQALKTYISALLESSEYLKYTASKEKLKQYPELKEQIDGFRKRSFELQSGRGTSLENYENLEREYERLIGNPNVVDFLEAELAFCRMMQCHSDKIMEAIEFE